MDSDTKTARPRRLHFTQRFDFNQHFWNFAFAHPQPWRKTSASLSVPLARSRKQVVPTIFVIRCMAAEHARLSVRQMCPVFAPEREGGVGRRG